MKKTSILIALLLWLPFGMGSSSAQSGYDLFQKALMLERTDGKLAEAILLYQRVVKESQDEPLAAKAQLQIGICYEKLGQSEARAAYQTVIDKYPRQMETVKAAKERISQLAAVSEPVPDKPKFRKVAIPFKLSWWSPTPSGPIVDFGARLSPDGRTLAFGSEGAIWLIPVPGNVSPDIAGEPRRLTKAMYAMGGGISWSADGSLIAFNAARAEGESQDVYVIPSEGGEPVRLVRREPGFGFAPLGEALSLSPDGKLLAYQSKWDGEGRAGWSRIQTIARGAASPNIVTETKSAQPSFSPDGRMIAYVNYRPMELRVIPASGGESVRVTDTANRAVASPVWSPGGDMLAFLTGTNMTPYDESWIVPVSEQGKGRYIIKSPAYERDAFGRMDVRQ
ncbi:MAG: tetratricopeptide repeat protein [Acidobacteriota bacterium]